MSVDKGTIARVTVNVELADKLLLSPRHQLTRQMQREAIAEIKRLRTALQDIAAMRDYQLPSAQDRAACALSAAEPAISTADVTLRETATDLLRAMQDDQRTVGYRLDLWNCLQDLLAAEPAIRGEPKP